jgi:hypothetical protein
LKICIKINNIKDPDDKVVNAHQVSDQSPFSKHLNVYYHKGSVIVLQALNTYSRLGAWECDIHLEKSVLYTKIIVFGFNFQ